MNGTPRLLLGLLLALAMESAAAELVGEAEAVGEAEDVHEAGRVDAARLAAANAEPGQWLAHGRTYDEQRYSPLTQITRENLNQLGLAWSYATGTTRGLEATPIVVDGVLYATGSWSVVYALDAATGAEIWRFDPEVPRAKGRNACCDVVNRGVAVWKGRVYVGTIDGRLVALDAGTGHPYWEVRTTDYDLPYTITGAPRVVKDKVIIGNGGGEFGVRGYFSAYDAQTGKRLWRFYTVPGPPTKPYEHPELEIAAKTWSKDSMWEAGLGGTVWDSFAYDPELDLLYVGVGNSTPYNREVRSPGGGDNLYLTAILAVKPDTGRLAWHYQTTPGEYWDYTATQHMILADLKRGDRVVPVLMQAPKNGFFYVLDRATGELLSAEPYVTVSWATGIDTATGRPVERSEAHWANQSATVTPGPEGGHNWHPMSYSPSTGLVYIPTIQMAYLFQAKPGFRYQPGRFNTGEDFPALVAWVEGYEQAVQFCSPTQLTAWDPVAQKRVWQVKRPTAVPAGVLSTASDLVFAANGHGDFSAYDARTGDELWSSPVGIEIMAPPVTYTVGGEQYLAVLAGVGGSAGLHFTRVAYQNAGRILAYKLGGKASLPAVAAKPAGRVRTPALEASAEQVVRGRGLYAEHCLRCHGIGARASGLLPDLRHSTRKVHDDWIPIVLGGTRAQDGMASFADVIDEAAARDIHAYVIERALHEPGMFERMASWFGEYACLPATWITD